jgi:putative transcriptional regulator
MRRNRERKILIRTGLVFFLALFPGAWMTNGSWAEDSDGPLKPGVFLFAAPRLNDPYFLHSVVLVVSYSSEGALGLIINRPTDVSVGEVLPKSEGIDGLSQPLFFGGPVSQNILVALFRSEKPPEASQKVFEDVYFTGSGKTLMDLLRKETQAIKVRVYGGYAGWAPRQLDGEVSRGDWIIMDADRETVFTEDPDDVWPVFFEGQKGIDIRHHPDPGRDFNRIGRPLWLSAP